MSKFQAVDNFLTSFDAHAAASNSAETSTRGAGVQFLAEFDEMRATVIEPTMREIAKLVSASGHSVRLQPVSVERPDPMLPPYPSLTFYFQPRNEAGRAIDQTPSLKLEADPKLMKVRAVTVMDNPKATFFESRVNSRVFSLDQITEAFIERELVAVLKSTVGGPSPTEWAESR